MKAMKAKLKSRWAFLTALVVAVGIATLLSGNVRTAYATEPETEFTEVADEASLLAAVANGESVRLTDDIALTSEVRIMRNLTVDLNGCKVTRNDREAFAVSAGEVCFTDNSNAGDGSVEVAKTISGYQRSVIRISSGTVTFEGGSYTGIKAEGGDSISAVYATGGEVIINGGTFTGVGEQAVQVYDTTELNISGGNFHGLGALSLSSTGSCTITGGVYNGSSADIYYGGGPLDLSGYQAADGMTIQGRGSAATDNITFPAGMALCDSNGIGIEGTMDNKVVYTVESCFAVSFAGNDGSGTMDAVMVKSGEEYTLPDCGFTAPEGKVFFCWSIPDADMYYDVGESFTVTEDTEVMAEWAETCTITYHANRGETPEETFSDETIVGEYRPLMFFYELLTEGGFTIPEGKVFLGWSTTPDGEREYLEGEPCWFEENTDLYAVWMKDKVVYLGGVEMKPEDYLAVDADEVSDTKPASGGYAYLKEDAETGELILTLNNYEYEGDGYLYFVDVEGTEYTSALCFSKNLSLVLKGKNSLTNTWEDGEGITGTVGGLMISGDGELELNGLCGIYCAGDTEMNGGTVKIQSASDGVYLAKGNLTIKGGTLLAYVGGKACSGIYISEGGELVVNGGGLLVDAAADVEYGIMAWDGVSLGEDMAIMLPEGGEPSEDTIVDAEGAPALTVLIMNKNKEHTLSEDYVSNSLYHWTYCEDSDCLFNSYPYDYSEHDTEGENGVCSVCGFDSGRENDVYVGNVGLVVGEYLADDGAITTTKPESGGYAYLEADENAGMLTLTLHDYKYVGEGYAYFDVGTAVIYTKYDLIIVLEGSNRLIDAGEFGSGIVAENNLVISGGELYISAGGVGIAINEGYLIIKDSNVTVYGDMYGIGAANISISGEDTRLKAAGGESAFYFLGIDIAPEFGIIVPESGNIEDIYEADEVIIGKVVDNVILGGVTMYDGDYLAVGASETSADMPVGEGYAYYKDRVLTLHNYEYEGVGYAYDEYGGEAYTSALYTDKELTIVLEESNSLINTADKSDGITPMDNLTIRGTGALTINAEYGIYAGGDVTIMGGTLNIAECVLGICCSEELTIGGTDTTISVQGCMEDSVAVMSGDINIAPYMLITCPEGGASGCNMDDSYNPYYTVFEADGETEATSMELVACDHRGSNSKNGYCETCGWYQDNMGALAGHSLSLSGNIGVNFHMELDEAVASSDTAKMVFTLPDGRTEEVMVNDDEVIRDEEDRYVFTCKVAASEMEAIITAQLVDGEQKGTVYTYTVKEYADYILDNSEVGAEDYRDEYAAAAEMVQTMLDYGAVAESYFSEDANESEITGTVEKIEAAYNQADKQALQACIPEVPEENGAFAYVGSSLVLESEIKVRHYFRLTAANAPAELNGLKRCEVPEGEDENGIYYCYESDGIAAAKLGDMTEYSVADITINYCPLSYITTVLANTNEDLTGDTELQNLMKSLYLYYQAAVAYQNQTQAGN